MGFFLTVLVLGLCVTSEEALGRDDRDPNPSWAAPESQQQARGNDAAGGFSESSRNSPKDDHHDRISFSAGSGAPSSELGLVQELSLISSDEALTAVSVMPTATYSHQDWFGEESDSPAIWITIAQRGLDYLKDVLLTEVLQAITPFGLPDITRTTRIPFVGEFSVSFDNITLVHATVPTSSIALGDVGITMQSFDSDVNLTLNWEYSYDNIWLLEPIFDSGIAQVKVVGMQAGVAVGVQECQGTLCMNVLQCGTYIHDLEVQVKGDGSWLYQWLVDGLEERLRATIEEQLSEKIQEGVQSLNLVLLQTPQQVQVDGMSELNFSVVSQPIITNTSISIGVKGQFVSPKSGKLVSHHRLFLPPGLVCGANMKMATIALSESVLADGAAIYYNADLLNWLLDNLPDRTLLNTYKWRFLIPQLYQQYPNKELILHFEVSDLPNVTLTFDGVDVTANAHMIVGVANGSSTIPVASISITIAASGMAGLNGNNITGQVMLKDLTLALEWSNVGKIHMTLVKVFLKALIKDAALPILNASLKRGLPLPVIPFMTLKDSIVVYGDGYLLVCTDIEYTKSTAYLQ